MRKLTPLAAVIIVLAGIIASVALVGRVTADDPNQATRTPGDLAIIGKDGKPAGACPLKHTEVTAQVAGFIARVWVVQEFTNPTDQKIEAVYTFPLPEDSAVDSMEMKVGERIIVGEIHKREEAKQIYDAAKEAGHVASLLDQERANIFTQSVANIEPGAAVKIRISYTQLLKYEAGTYEFNFPMVVGPRFIPGTPVGHEGAGRADDTVEVPDASKITPPITPKGTRAGHDISLTVDINEGIPINGIKCLSHEISTEYPDENTATVALKNKVEIPNKDFVLKIDVAGEAVQSGVITSAPDGKGGYFALVMQPPKAPKPKYVTPKEMIFVIDTSGSQMGEPLAKSKETMLHCIKNVNSGDTFQMISFSGGVKKLFDKPQPYTSENLASAQKFLKDCEAGGGTNMLPAIQEALANQADSKRLRIVVFFTDGYIGNDFQIIDTVQKNLGSARVFSFGIGSSVNRFLIEKMAEEGRGVSDIVLLNADSKEVASKFYDRIRNPLLTDITIDWGGLPIVAEEVYPRRSPDLFSAQPLVLKGYYTKPASGEITLRAKVNGKPWAMSVGVDLPEIEPANDALASIWARSKVDDLMSKDWMGAQSGKPDTTIHDKIVDLALSYHLMTQYTSFVAVERMVVTSGGKPTTIAVPVEMPEGVSYEGVMADQLSLGRAAKVASLSLNWTPTRGTAYYAYGATKAASAPAPTASTTAGGYGGLATAPAGTPASAAQSAPVSSDGAVVLADVDVKDGETAEQKRDRAVKQRLDRALLELIDKYKKSGDSGDYSVPGKLVVKDGKVEVMIWVKSGDKEKLAELEKLGLTDRTWAIDDKILIGWLPIAKLEDAAQLDVITRIGLPVYVTGK